MRRLVILLVGGLIWLSGGVLLAQTIPWDKLMVFFQYQDSLHLELDDEHLEKLDNWEEPNLMPLPDHLKSQLLRPYYFETHPGQRQEADWQASRLYQEPIYSYAFQDLSEGGHAMILLGQDHHGPYLLLLTYNADNQFVDALTLFADYNRQEMQDEIRSEWLAKDLLSISVSSTWEDPSLRQTRTDVVRTDYRLFPDGRIIQQPSSSGSPNH
ncbi:MAG: hypothetical protein AAGM67_10205 [Bacteroidota bacterium]